MSLPFREWRTARQPRPCASKPGCTIQAGERYEVEAWPPWALFIDDVDEDGSPTGSPLGHWETRAFHGACEAGRLYGDPADEAAERELMARAYGED